MRRILTAAILATTATMMTGCAHEPPPVSEKVAQAYASMKASPPTLKEDSRRHAVVIGDSYTQGMGNKVVWPDAVSAARNISITNDAVIGTGYVSGSKTFMEQAKIAVNDQPDIIILVGSRNDSATPDGVAAAANATLDFIQKNAPEVKIIVIGPIWSSEAPPTAAHVANEGVRAAATAHKVPFIDALAEDWLSDPAWIQADGVHPTDKGEGVLATKISAKLAANGV